MVIRWLLLGLAMLFASLSALSDDTPPPVEVTVGAYVNDIQAIDLSRHSYVVDFYLWFRWNPDDPDPTGSFELMNTFDPEAHVETVLYDEPVPQPDGTLYQIIRHQGAFSSKFPLENYPFDHQRLVVAVEDSENGSNLFRYVADDPAVTLNPDITLPGYTLDEVTLTIRDKPYTTAFGDLAQPDVAAYSRVEFSVLITRPWLSGLLKIFLPVLLVLLCAIAALLLDPTHVEARIGLSITALLTLVALQFTLLSGLPEVSYLTLLDQFFIASYLLVLVIVALIVRGTRLDEEGALQGGSGATARLARGGPASALIVGLSYLTIVALIGLGNLL